MPVILSREDVARWLDPTNENTDDVMRLVRPCPEEWLEMVPVSRRVNKVENDDAALMDAVAAPEGALPKPPKKAAQATTRRAACSKAAIQRRFFTTSRRKNADDLHMRRKAELIDADRPSRAGSPHSARWRCRARKCRRRMTR